MDQSTINDVTRLVRRFLPPNFDVEDVAIQILFETWSRHLEFPSKKAIHDRCCNVLRRSRVEKRYLMSTTKPETVPNPVDLHDEINSLVGVLSPRERKVIWYRFYQDLSIVEVAKRVKSSVVETREVLERALFKMRASSVES